MVLIMLHKKMSACLNVCSFFPAHPQLWTSDTAADECEGGDEGQTEN